MKNDKIRITITLEKEVYEEIQRRVGLVKISTWINNYLKENLRNV